MSKANGSDGFSVKVPACVEGTCYERRGIVMPNIMGDVKLDCLLKMETRPDDIFIVTYPKAGTTWLVQIAILIGFEGDASKMADKHVMDLIPFLEVSSPEKFKEIAEMTTSPRITKTHVISDWLPEAIRAENPRSKVIYVARNPKDLAVSYFHFCRFQKMMPAYESWDVFIEEYMAGRAPFGTWFQNVLPWWKQRDHPNVLFLTYEDMKKDLPKAVGQIAKFMDKPLSDDVITKIAEQSTFSAMKNNKASNPDSKKIGRETSKDASFMRKGQVGDWKNYFTQEQSERFDELYKKEMAGSGLEMVYELAES